MPPKQAVEITSFDNGEVQIRTPVLAFVIGPLAVHRELDNDYQNWAVSHVKTGYRVKGMIKTRTRAIRVAKALQHLDWNFRSPKSRKVKAMASKVVHAVNLTP